MNSQAIVLAAAGEPDAAVRAALDQAGFPVQAARFDAAPGEGRLAVGVTANAVAPAAAFCRQWRAARGHDAAIVWIADALDPTGRTAGWQAGADAVLVRPLALGELPAQVTRLLDWHA